MLLQSWARICMFRELSVCCLHVSMYERVSDKFVLFLCSRMLRHTHAPGVPSWCWKQLAQEAWFSHFNTRVCDVQVRGDPPTSEMELLWQWKWFGNFWRHVYLGTWHSPLECTHNRCRNKMFLSCCVHEKDFCTVTKFHPFSTSSLDMCEEGKCAGEWPRIQWGENSWICTTKSYLKKPVILSKISRAQQVEEVGEVLEQWKETKEEPKNARHEKKTAVANSHGLILDAQNWKITYTYVPCAFPFSSFLRHCRKLPGILCLNHVNFQACCSCLPMHCSSPSISVPSFRSWPAMFFSR